MQLRRLIGIALATLVAAYAAPAAAQDDANIAGKYAASFEEVANNCKDTGMNLSRATIEIFQKEKKLDVAIPMVPNMRGKLGRAGKLKAKAKKGKTGIEGVQGQFSIAGRAKSGTLQLVFIAEYYRNDSPLCTQSWNVSGKKK